MPVASFILGAGLTSYQDAFGVAQLAAMKRIGATAVTIDPYFLQATATATSIRGTLPHGLHTIVKLTGTTAVTICTTATATGVTVASVSTNSTGNPQTIYSATTDYLLTGNTIKRRTGSTITSGETVMVFCDQYLRTLALAAKNAGLEVWLKPMIRTTAGAKWATGPMRPGATVLTVKTTATSKTITAAGFTSTMVGRRCLSTATGLPNSQVSNYGRTSPTDNLTGAHDTTCWSYIKSVVAGTSATLNVAAKYNKAAMAAVIIDDTTAQAYFYDSTTAPTRASWLGIITWMVKQCQAVGVTPAGIELSTEQTEMASWYETPWRHVCTYLHTKYPSMKLGLSSSSRTTIQATYPCHWATACDFIGQEGYLGGNSGVPAGGTSLATLEGYWTAWITKFKALSAAWTTKPLIFTEIGWRAFVGCATHTVSNETAQNQSSAVISIPSTTTATHAWTTLPTATFVFITSGHPVTTSAGTTTVAATLYTVSGANIKRKASGNAMPTTIKVWYFRVSEVTQANSVQAFINKCWGQSWFGGFHYWEWSQEGKTTYFSPKTRKAATVFRQQLAQRAGFAPVL